MKRFYLTCTIIFFQLFNSVNAQCTFTTSVPYYESFAGNTNLNQLPTCWAASNLGNTCLTYTSPQTQGRIARTGNQFASFCASPIGANFFYTNGIQLNAGSIYSISVWYITEYFGYTNWSDLSLLLGTNQNSVSMVSLASTNGPAFSNIYKSISTTFTIAASGIYFCAIRATSSTTSGALYLTFDDLKIDSVCSNFNINVVSNPTFVCNGSSAPISFTASSAVTNSWSTGGTGTVTTFTANSSAGNTFSISGTNNLSGCSSTASIQLPVQPSPNLSINASSASLCLGKSCDLTAHGASSYTWNTGQTSASIVITPTASSSYTVTGTNSFGCTNSAVQYIPVNPIPTISIISAISSNTICSGDKDTLTASGALNYIWTDGQNTWNSYQIIVSPTLSTNYTVTGEDNNACQSQTSLNLTVSGCTGINQIPLSQHLVTISPNPFQDEILLSSESHETKQIEITDLSGRKLLSIETNETKLYINTKFFSKGLYCVKVAAANEIVFFKIIKN